MPSVFRQGAIVLALIGAAGLVAAHQGGSGQDGAVVGPTFPGDETTSSIDYSARPEWIELSDEQRGFIFLGVMNLADVPEADVLAPGPADSVPASVELQDMPAMVTRKIPQVRDHKFVKLNDRILVVRPRDRAVVAEIPRYRLLP
jgi:hypothetical protein